ncbi:acylneuraminate cytidylyltransferase [Flavobacterium psychrophilum]|uniref:acylneuraminate cytidylyltransferase family protein n=1 Tax=Flavobacterium psychrophilum TaxID=96345 RepID=UPI0004D0DE04|nr:acylneuraminate cytidylyltransferase family protein [Flavobacterium psychrophilum]AIG30049.1 acylneuraminate cytidylyltransferase [Flavobacterium psychrophilum]AIG32325.1 acylneuraminate cytidylyltransferase [Flavobacterium psychrophilum]AIG34483.1 acylneuraminate cytidylyltransferase [Flavobacterium psychrophilum]AIG36843.1 acylneuraminate cytidylyltransferase [Flavobacterium psychrophilum]AIG39107.1 acylneuraminate cytidylyltransferase [Flavobacterium psychrophilum]
MKNKTIVIIPARGNSKRLPGKNTRLLGGIPLLAHSIKYAQQFSFIKDIYVTTDNLEIKNIALQFGAQVIDRPAEISGDFEPTVSALKHVIASLPNDVENVILLQPTNPLRPLSLLAEAFQIYLNSDSDSLFTVSRNQNKLGKIVQEKFQPFNYKIGQRSQDLEPLFYENGLLYITKASLIRNDIIISNQAFPLEVNHIFAKVDIDTQEDFDYAEYLFKKETFY